MSENPQTNIGETSNGVQKLIADAKTICIIPSGIHEPESLTAALALFYTLKELQKNVNLIEEDIPSKFSFLIPPLDFISQPKNFVIAIPKEAAEVSQVYYEKTEGNLKIHLTIDKGNIKKDNISFYFADAKPDLIITLGIKDFQKELGGKLDSFGFLLESPILNIDSFSPLTAGNQESFGAGAFDKTQDGQDENRKFGQFNIIEKASLSETVLELIKTINPNVSNKNTANCLLTGLTLHYDNFQNENTGAKIFELCSYL